MALFTGRRPRAGLADTNPRRLETWAGLNVRDYTGSNFHQNIINTTGLEALESRGELKQYALKDPNGYTEERMRVYNETLQTMVHQNYEIIWKLLANGKYPTMDGTEAQIMIDNRKWAPRESDKIISDLGNGFAESVRDAFDEIFSKVLPDNFAALAEDRMKQIGKVQGVAESTANARARSAATAPALPVPASGAGGSSV